MTVKIKHVVLKGFTLGTAPDLLTSIEMVLNVYKAFRLVYIWSTLFVRFDSLLTFCLTMLGVGVRVGFSGV